MFNIYTYLMQLSSKNKYRTKPNRNWGRDLNKLFFFKEDI